MNQRVLVLFGLALLPLMMGCATARVARLPKDQTLTKESAVHAIGQIAKEMTGGGNVYHMGISMPARDLVGADDSGWEKITYLWDKATPYGGGTQFVPLKVVKVYYKDIDRVEIFSSHWSYWLSMGACTLFMLNFDGMTREGHVVMKDGSAQKVNWMRQDAAGVLSSLFGGVLFPGYILAYNLPDRYLQQKLCNFEYMRLRSLESSMSQSKSILPSGIPCSLCKQSGMIMNGPIYPAEREQTLESK